MRAPTKKATWMVFGKEVVICLRCAHPNAFRGTGPLDSIADGCRGAHGEMVLSVGKSVYLYEKGADGIAYHPLTSPSPRTRTPSYPILWWIRDAI